MTLPRAADRTRVRHTIPRCDVCGGVLRAAKHRGDPSIRTYVVERDGYVKIGSSRNPTSRISGLRTKTVPGVVIPEGMDWRAPLATLAVLPGDLEHDLHRRFVDAYVVGEWFRPTPALRAWLAKENA